MAEFQLICVETGEIIYAIQNVAGLVTGAVPINQGATTRTFKAQGRVLSSEGGDGAAFNRLLSALGAKR